MAAVLGTMQPFRYRGYVYDEETGLYYLRSRYYSAEWLRFVNADMLLQPNFNLFAYCMQNPINRVDPDGATDFCQADMDMMSNRSLLCPYNLSSIGGGFRGNTADIQSGYFAWKNTQAYDESWINSPYNTSPSCAGNTATPDMLKRVATEAAKQYMRNNPGRGAVYGTKGHTYVETKIKEQQWSNVDVEVSYKDTHSADYGTKGSVRLDIVLFNSGEIPIYAIDLKFGFTPLTQRRIDQINKHLPNQIHIDQVP